MKKVRSYPGQFRPIQTRRDRWTQAGMVVVLIVALSALYGMLLELWWIL